MRTKFRLSGNLVRRTASNLVDRDPSRRLALEWRIGNCLIRNTETIEKHARYHDATAIRSYDSDATLQYAGINRNTIVLSKTHSWAVNRTPKTSDAIDECYCR